jgi:steroid delta-isomerase-like uncharacterized protein
MSSKNVETVRAAQESWNNRDFAASVKHMADNVVYTDQARGLTMSGKEECRKYFEGWARAFSDGRIQKPEYIDGGDVVVALFTAEGTNDGQFGNFRATGKRISMPFCEIMRFDKQGQIVGGTAYYDQYTLLFQLGYAQQLPKAA